MMSKMIESFLQSSTEEDVQQIPMPGGPIYYKRETSHCSQVTLKDLESGVPLTAMLASASQANLSTLSLPVLRQRLGSTPDTDRPDKFNLPTANDPMRSSRVDEASPLASESNVEEEDVIDLSKRLPMLIPDPPNTLDFLSVPGLSETESDRKVPLIPFEELMLIDTIGSGRISTIYRAAWQHGKPSDDGLKDQIQMVALKVAMVKPNSNDSSSVDELRQEADIAARLNHPCVSSLVGVAADAECFCLAYDFCEGGSLLSLLNDCDRYYEYLPIALDIANGMAYLHSRKIIHRDLKPSNVLLTGEHRAKISDFGMSIRNHGQELTAETGTYRYMAP